MRYLESILDFVRGRMAMRNIIKFNIFLNENGRVISYNRLPHSVNQHFQAWRKFILKKKLLRVLYSQ